MKSISRRAFITATGASGVGIAVAGCAPKAQDQEVTAVEDLMREHGILRRALLVYAESARRLRQNATPAILAALQNTAQLFRSFGEDYHEKRLEESYIFPALQRGRASMSGLVATLLAQHERGRQITDYIGGATQPATITEDRAAELAPVLESFVLMYLNHAAREDTVIFPAWKQVLPAGELNEMGEEFEDIEHEQFGEDGFEKALRQITEIEDSLGLADIAQFTAQPPPRA
jgi:hemerythrin-like domain-containing protein